MADNKENGRADLFEILNEVHDGNTDKSAEDINNTESHVEDIIKILSGYSEEANEEIVEDEQDISEGEIPASIFGHLSDEGTEEIEKAVPFGENNPHFTEETEPAPELPVTEDDEDEEEDSDEEYEEDSKVKKVGRFFRGMSFIPKAIIYIALVVIASAYLSYYIITIGNDIFALVTDSREVTVTIEEGATDESVAKMLEEKGIIKYGWVYELYMKYRGDGDSEDEYIVGEHKINQSFNYSQIITALTTGNTTRKIVRVTIPEGFTVEQIIDLLIENEVGQRDDYIEAINNYPYKWDFVKALEEIGYSEDRIYRLEGYLYPDTYEFYTNEDEVLVINKMLNAFYDRFWKDFVEKDDEGNSFQDEILNDYGMTFDDVVTLASMVQSEGGTAEDFYYVSYVFHNRLDHSDSFAKLESDATIQYVLPERVDSTELNVSYETPYNTYLYEGLPPGAISNPGLDALSAVMFPEAPKNDDGNEIDAYYFVANNAGKTYYAATKSGHENNKAQAKADNEAIEAGTYVG